MSITILVCQRDVVDPASGEVVVGAREVIPEDRLYETCRRVDLAGRPFPPDLFRRVMFPDRAAYEAQTRLAWGRRYTDQPGEPVCIITARAVEAAGGGCDVYLPADADRIWTSTVRRREDWASVEQFAEWLCLETGADYCLLTARYRHGGELTGLGWWPPKIYKTGCRGRHVQRTQVQCTWLGWLGCPRCP